MPASKNSPSLIQSPTQLPTQSAHSALKVACIPAFTDNYLWVLHNDRYAIAVDPGDAAPIINYLVANELQLIAILATHHHNDHVGGIDALLDFFSLRGNAMVYGPANDGIPSRTHSHVAGKSSTLSIPELDLTLQIIDVPGHTRDHIAYYLANEQWLFCGDTLFAGGCGRMFEGTPGQMQNSLAKLQALPAATKVFCAHEYTLSNLRFAIAVEPHNIALQERIKIDTAKREHGIATVPSTIADEIATNPFLRWTSAEVIASAKSKPEHWRGFSAKNGWNGSPVGVFGTLREWKNHF
jgi:hydroxyacylglutathione hydrolase